MPLSYPVAPPSQRELHKDGGGGGVRRVLYVLALHESTATVTGPAAPSKDFKRSKSTWRDDEETVDAETLGGVEGSWG